MISLQFYETCRLQLQLMGGIQNFDGKQNATYNGKLSKAITWMRNFPSRIENTYLLSTFHNNGNRNSPSLREETVSKDVKLKLRHWC